MNRKSIVAIFLLVLIIGGGLLAVTAGIFTQDPEEVDLANTTDAPSSGTIEDFDGTWTVDNTSGSFAGYRIQEEFAGVGANTAVGRTQNVAGTMTIAGDEITDVDLTVDMTTLASDKDMRDNALRDRGIESDTYPTATFKLTQPVAVADEPEAAEEVDAEATGDFTLHGVTKEVTIPIRARWSGEQITVVSSFDVLLADYDIERPTTQRVVSIAEEGKVEMQLLFSKV